MWDLEALRYLNEQAHLRAIELINERSSPPAQGEKETGPARPPPIFPLSILARKLIGGPPSLSYFIELLEMGDTFISFRDMVREYIPEYEVNIMAEELDSRAQKFSQLFSKKYFPLTEFSQGDEVTISDLLEAIPAQPIGFSYESYHRFADFRDGYVLALSLVECPWEEDPLGLDDYEDENGVPGARIPLLEAVGEMVGEGLVRLIPDGGWTAKYLHEKTDGTEFNGLGDFADWVAGDTGYYHLDALGESVDTGEHIDWTRENVDELTSDWKEASEMLEGIHNMALLLEQDTVATFTRLIALLVDEDTIIVPKEQLRLPLD